MILALDTATTSGWAYGRLGGVPLWGSVPFGQKGRSNGEIISRFRDWLGQKIAVVQPTLIVFESPWVGRKSSEVILRRLMSFAGFDAAHRPMT